jgi:hypothetical protein
MSDGSQQAMDLSRLLISGIGDRLTYERTSMQTKTRSRIYLRMLSEGGREQGTERMRRGQDENRFPHRSPSGGLNSAFGNRLHFPLMVNIVRFSGEDEAL